MSFMGTKNIILGDHPEGSCFNLQPWENAAFRTTELCSILEEGGRFFKNGPPVIGSCRVFV